MRALAFFALTLALAAPLQAETPKQQDTAEKDEALAAASRQVRQADRCLIEGTHVLLPVSDESPDGPRLYALVPKEALMSAPFAEIVTREQAEKLTRTYCGSQAPASPPGWTAFLG